MSSDLHRRALLLGTEGLTEAESAELSRHVEGCRECRERQALLGAAREVARGQRVGASARSRRVIWEEVSRLPSARGGRALPAGSGGALGWWPRVGWAGAAGVVVLLLVLAVDRVAGPVAPSTVASSTVDRLAERHGELERAPSGQTQGSARPGGTLVARRPVSIALGGGEVGLSPGVRFGVEGDSGGTTVVLEHGRVEVGGPTRAEPRELWLTTAEVRLGLFGARAIIVKDERSTSISVERGSATLWPRGAPLPVTLGPGDRRVVGALPAGAEEEAGAGSSVPRPRSPVPGAGPVEEVPGRQPGVRGPVELSSLEPRGPPPEGPDPGSARGLGVQAPLEPRPEQAPDPALQPRPDPAHDRALEPGPLPGGQGERSRAAHGEAVEAPSSEVETLQAARRALPSDAPRAAALAGRALQATRVPAVEAEALAVLADAERRRGRLLEALALYRRLAGHPSGAAYAEEAHLQSALILERTGAAAEALAELDRAEARFPRGPTGPERAALAAGLLLSRGDPEGAAAVIERAPTAGRSLELLRRRLEVARVLAATDPPRARRISSPLLEADNPPELRAAARELLEKIK